MVTFFVNKFKLVSDFITKDKLMYFCSIAYIYLIGRLILGLQDLISI